MSCGQKTWFRNTDLDGARRAEAANGYVLDLTADEVTALRGVGETVGAIRPW